MAPELERWNLGFLAELEQVAPGTARVIVEQITANTVHQREMQRRQWKLSELETSANFVLGCAGQAGIVLTIAMVLGTTCFLAYCGSGLAAFGVIVTALVGIAGHVILPQLKRQHPRMPVAKGQQEEAGNQQGT